jgi:uncharacterized repeat protein (TIGR01451 family)
MSKKNILFLLSAVCMGAAFFVIAYNGRVTAETPLCADTDIRVGQEITCDIEVENTGSNDLNSVRAEITVPDGTEITSHDRVWSCSESSNTLTCTKDQSPALEPGESDLLEITFTANK